LTKLVIHSKIGAGILLMFLLASMNAWSQTTFFLEKTGRFKHFEYYEGSMISLQIQDSLDVSGRITLLNDREVQIDGLFTFAIESISGVYRERTMLKFLGGGLFGFGALYFGLTGINRTLNKEYPVFLKEALITGPVCMLSGIALLSTKARLFKIGTKWKIKVLDLSI
jgi:hypothetical protein